jgi:hypothetical protein
MFTCLLLLFLSGGKPRTLLQVHPPPTPILKLLKQCRCQPDGPPAFMQFPNKMRKIGKGNLPARAGCVKISRIVREIHALAALAPVKI